MSAQSCVPPFSLRTEKTDVPGDCMLSRKRDERKSGMKGQMLLESGGNDNKNAGRLTLMHINLEGMHLL